MNLMRRKQAQDTPVSLGDAVNDSVHSLEEPVLLSVLAAQQDGGQRGRKRERVEGGNRNRECDGQRELAKQNAGGAGEKCHRHKHRDQHQRGGDDGSGYFRHGDRGRFVSVALTLLNVAFDVFDDDDGVVHHQSGGQRDAEQGEGIDRESQKLDEGESSDQ